MTEAEFNEMYGPFLRGERSLTEVVAEYKGARPQAPGPAEAVRSNDLHPPTGPVDVRKTMDELTRERIRTLLKR